MRECNTSNVFYLTNERLTCALGARRGTATKPHQPLRENPNSAHASTFRLFTRPAQAAHDALVPKI